MITCIHSVYSSGLVYHINQDGNTRKMRMAALVHLCVRNQTSFMFKTVNIEQTLTVYYLSISLITETTVYTTLKGMTSVDVCWRVRIPTRDILEERQWKLANELQLFRSSGICTKHTVTSTDKNRESSNDECVFTTPCSYSTQVFLSLLLFIEFTCWIPHVHTGLHWQK